LKLSKDENSVVVDQSLYRSMIGSLLYLTASRPDITFVVGLCVRCQAEPKMSHLVQVKRILKDINGTIEYGILYSHSDNSRLIGYCDADWAGSVDDKKVYQEAVSFLGTILYHGSKRNKILCHYQQLKQNISLQEVAALS